MHRIGPYRQSRRQRHRAILLRCEERAYHRDIQKLTGLRIPIVQDHPFTAEDEDDRRPLRKRHRYRRPARKG